jgi:hypothetical protein
MRDISEVTKMKHKCLYDNDKNRPLASALLYIPDSNRDNQNVRKICINWRCLLQ